MMPQDDPLFQMVGVDDVEPADVDDVVYAVGGPPASTKAIYSHAETAIAAITEFERLLAGDDCPLPAWLTSKYTLRCKSMVTELLHMSDEWAKGAGTATWQTA